MLNKLKKKKYQLLHKLFNQQSIVKHKTWTKRNTNK